MGKLQARLSEAESTTEQLNGKLRQLDNAKNKIQGEINEVAAQCDQAHILNSSMEKKAKQLIELLQNGKEKLMDLEWILTLHKRRQETHLPSYLESNPRMK